jgi:Tfp pilus assembly protein PilX
MLTRRIDDERGNALVISLFVMMVLLAFGIATAVMVEGDQRDSLRERTRESSFQITEGVLNAQIYQLSTRWPGATEAPYPPACGTADTATDCPNGASVAANFTSGDYAAGTQWTTQVRDNGGASPNFWSDALLTSQPSYDANDDNFVWVRATATVRGRQRTLVALVEAENTTINFPRATLVSGHFQVSNNGNKVMIDTNGEANQFTSPGDIIVRCPLTTASCADYDAGKDQISPNTIKSVPTQPRAVAIEVLDLLRDQARADGNYYAGCSPSLAGDQPGEVVFMEDATGCQWNANTTYNTLAKPGYVVIASGGIAKINGTATFHGIIYHANVDNQTGYLITLEGNVSIYGAIVIDGPGGLSAGSSKVNLVYDPNVFNNFKAFGTAGIVQNTFREIVPGT